MSQGLGKVQGLKRFKGHSRQARLQKLGSKGFPVSYVAFTPSRGHKPERGWSSIEAANPNINKGPGWCYPCGTLILCQPTGGILIFGSRRLCMLQVLCEGERGAWSPNFTPQALEKLIFFKIFPPCI